MMQEKNTHDLQDCKVSWIYACNFLIGPPSKSYRHRNKQTELKTQQKNGALRRK